MHGRALFRAQRRKRNPPFAGERGPVRRVLIFEDSAREDSDKVRVTVGESRHHQLASPIDVLRIRKARHDLISRTNGCDEIVFDGNGGIEMNG